MKKITENIERQNKVLPPQTAGRFIFFLAMLLMLGASGPGLSCAASEGVLSPPPAAAFSVAGKIKSTFGALGSVTVRISGPEEKGVTTGPDGAYSLDGLPAGTYKVTPEKGGYSFLPPDRTVTIGNAAVESQDFTGLRDFSISGRIAGTNGSPAAGVEVVLLDGVNNETLTDADGRYSFELLRNGSYSVIPRKIGRKFVPEQRKLTIESGSKSGVDFEIEP